MLTTNEPSDTYRELKRKGYMETKGKWRVRVAGMAVILALAAGCKSTPNDGRSEGTVMDDKSITEDVQKSLESDPTYKFDNVSVKTFAGTVQLSGFVTTESARNRAGELARRVQGPREIVNSITLKPLSLAPTGRPATETQPQQSPPPQPSGKSE